MNTPASKPLHPRNRHKDGYDFAALTNTCPELKPYLLTTPYGGVSVNFSDPVAVKTLNAALLKNSYGIQGWDIPEGALCPPVPGRVDYIHYMADLVAESSEKNIRMLDIGTGANMIYPLLAASIYGWQCVGSDISEPSLKNASAILSRNPQISKLCELRLQSDKHAMFSGMIQSGEYFDITVCNPPFHASAEEAQSGSKRKVESLARNRGEKLKPAAPVLNFGGMENELWCNGGEALFLKKMIKESKDFATQVGWFSSLVSKSDNLKPLQKQLQKLGAADVRVIEMTQGKKIARILAWTFR